MPYHFINGMPCNAMLFDEMPCHLMLRHFIAQFYKDHQYFYSILCNDKGANKL